MSIALPTISTGTTASPILQSLPVVVLSPHSRCNCRCLMCDIWKDTTSVSFSLDQLNRLLDDFERLSVKWVVLSGGEPLMHPQLFAFCSILQKQRIRTTLLSTGLLFQRYANQIVETVDEAIVSLDGPAEIHDRIRRVRGAYRALALGVESIHYVRSNFPISARTTVQRENFSALSRTASAAKTLGLRSISFLAADVTSEAFNRPEGWNADRQSEIALSIEDVCRLENEIDALVTDWSDSGFVLESAAKLRRLALHYRAQLGFEEPIAPQCNAPWTSAVIEADGTVRPCFFHRPIGRLGNGGLLPVLNGPEAVIFRSQLNVATNPICKRCVCSLNWKQT